MNKEKITELYNCVKENYDLIIKLFMLKEESRNPKNILFKYLLFSLRDTFMHYDYFHKISKFKKNIKESEYFNFIFMECKRISNIAKSVADHKSSIIVLYNEAKKYFEKTQDFYIKYSLI